MHPDNTPSAYPFSGLVPNTSIQQQLDMPFVFEFCCLRCGLTQNEALKTRREPCVSVRHISMFVMRNLLGVNVVKIAKFFGIDHASVCHAIKSLRYHTERYSQAMKILNLLEQPL